MKLRQYRQSTNAARNKFTGKERDEGSSYDIFEARPYDASVGRWLIVDPLADLTPGLTPYNYCYNNPINYVDPLGLTPTDNNSGEPQREYELPPVVITAPRYKGGDLIDSYSAEHGSPPNNGVGLKFQSNFSYVNTLTSGIGIGLSTYSPSMYAKGWRRGISGNYLLTGRNYALFAKNAITSYVLPFRPIWRLGVGIENTTTALSVVNIVFIEPILVYNGDLSLARYSYHFCETTSSLLAANFIAPPAGFAVSAYMISAELFFDRIIVPAILEINRQAKQGTIWTPDGGVPAFFWP